MEELTGYQARNLTVGVLSEKGRHRNVISMSHADFRRIAAMSADKATFVTSLR
jgi:hypothetical protein